MKRLSHTTSGDEMNQNRLRYAFQLLLFIAISLFNTQLIPFLKDVGYDTLQQGYILTFNALFSIILQVLFGYLCDHYRSMKKFFMIGYALFLIFGCLMFYKGKQLFFFHLITCSMMSGMVKVLSALIETWMLYLDEAKFGNYRAAGALGLCIGSIATGIILDYYSYAGIIISALVVSIIVLGLSFYCDEVTFESSVDIKKMFSLLKNKPYLYMVCIYFLIYIVGTADQYVVVDKMIELNASKTMIGIKWAVQSLLEIPFFFYASKLSKKYSPYTLLRWGIVMYGVKFALYGFVETATWIIIVTSLQIVTLPVIAYTSKLIMDELSGDLKASSQMLAMAVFIGGSALVTPLITSYLIVLLGFDMTLYACALFVLLPLLLLCFKGHFIKDMK